MAKIDYRTSAKHHVAAARDLLESHDDKAVRYACLELRMAIEALTYDNLQTYLAEAPNSAMVHWTPKKVIDELLAVDPYVDQSAKIHFGKQKAFGQPSDEMHFLGEDKKFTVAWANKAHNALGSFLHEPTIGQHVAGSAALSQKARAKAEEIASELGNILSATVFHVNVGRYVEFVCECGFRIKRKDRALREDIPVECRECRRRYSVHQGEGGEYRFRLSDHAYECTGCKTAQTVGDHEVQEGRILVCSECGAKAIIRVQYLIEQAPSAAADST